VSSTAELAVWAWVKAVANNRGSNKRVFNFGKRARNIVIYINESNHIVPQNAAQPHLNMTNRSALRALLLAQRQCVGPAERQAREVILVKELAQYIEHHHKSAPVALYMPHAGEPNVLALAALISNPLCLPVVINKGEVLQFAKWQAGDVLIKDCYGIQTPAKQAWISPQILLIPCVGYTKTGFRLGYGGGYYDRTLAAQKNKGAAITAVGIAWHQAGCGLQPSEHDIAMDLMQLA
jgi:5-formyltetrahydrofolate cyclo-ligase